VDTQVVVRKGDRLVVSASGQIWAGNWGINNSNGPQGWDKKDCDPKFPLPCSYPYALLGKLNGSYFYIGSGIERIQNGGDSKLYLRINDDTPGNGSGSFTANIQVYRDESSPPSGEPHQCSDTKDNDGDGKIDFGTGANNDPGCESAIDDTESPDPSTGPIPGNTAPTIDPLKPAPGSKIHNSSPLIAAKVSDAETDLAQSNIKLFVDGKPVTNFSYDAATDRLSYRSGKLTYGGHTVKVEATDASALKGENTWTFKVVKR
jgi:hypothetical protein